MEEHQLDDTRLKRVFEMWWPELNSNLEKILSTSSSRPEKTSPKEKESTVILEELLDLVRSQQRLLANPERILPPEYFQYLLDNYSDSIGGIERFELLIDRLMYADNLTNKFFDVFDEIRKRPEQSISKTEMNDLENMLKRLVDVIHDATNVVNNVKRKSRR